MRSLWILLPAFVSSVSFAAIMNQTKWEPLSMEFPASAVTAGLDQLRNDKDDSLLELESQTPGFAKRYAQATSKFATMAFNTVSMPLTFPNRDVAESDETNSEWVSYVIGKYIKNLSAYALGEAMDATAPGFNETVLKAYVYCSTHTDNGDDYCRGTYGYNGLNWVFTRRLISSAAFVDAICPAITPVAVWNLKWNAFSATNEKEIVKFFDELDRMLAFIYGNGKWTTARLDTFKTFFDPNFARFLIRRYLDGGPKFIEAARNCATMISDEYYRQGDAGDKTAAKKIGDILRFKKVALTAPLKDLEMNTADLDRDTVFRLTHRYEMSKAIPWAKVYPDNFPTNYSDYVSTLLYRDKLSVRRLAPLLYQLAKSDLKYTYRTLNRAEFTELNRVGELPRGEEAIAIVEGDLFAGTAKYYYGLPDGKIVEESELDGAPRFIIIRDARPNGVNNSNGEL